MRGPLGLIVPLLGAFGTAAVHAQSSATSLPQSSSRPKRRIIVEKGILAVCDVYDALVSPRIYRPA